MKIISRKRPVTSKKTAQLITVVAVCPKRTIIEGKNGSYKQENIPGMAVCQERSVTEVTIAKKGIYQVVT